jgi:hypothetical protein
MYRAALFARRTANRVWRLTVWLVPAAVLALSGCRTAPLDAARINFQRGRVAMATDDLTAREAEGKDRVLFWMERGTIQQAAGDFQSSTRDFVSASDRIEELETYSLSGGAASLVINDTVQDFRAAPYERTLLHSMTALNHFAEGRWDDAAVEARRILRTLDPERRGEYPEDAFSRYVAGFAFEMTDDPSNAALQYRLAAARAELVRVDDRTGRLSLPPEPGTTEGGTPAPDVSTELVVFLLLGDNIALAGDARESNRRRDYAEIWMDDRILGRSFLLADSQALFSETARLEALRKALKTGSRLVLKEILAESAAQSTDSDAIGDLVRLILYGLLEKPDLRRWETLPMGFHVARVPCPPTLESFTVVVKTPSGGVIRSRPVRAPLHRRRSVWVSVVRDLPIPPPPPSPTP